jgi:RNA polymerase sigma factor (sigma-70 family)
MANSQLSEVIQHLRRTVLLRDGAGLTDGQLLDDYLHRRDEGALAALVLRHGPMVWGVCHRVLRDHHDAEDAFQAAFLVLVRKAASVVPREMVANWLYGVAHQTALKARAVTAKRRVRERQVTEMPEPATAEPLWNDLQPLLDQELSRLPDKYRVAIVLCDLEAKTRKEAARQLGVPDGTLAARLARGRVMLAKRLARRGLAVSGGALGAMLAQNVASAGVPTLVVSSTIKAATLFAAGQTAAAGVISAKAAALTDGVLKSMLLTKLKIATAVCLIAGVTLCAVGVLAQEVWAEVEPTKGTVATLSEPPESGSEKAATGSAQAGDPLNTGAPLRAGPPRVMVEHKSPVACLAWSPDGRWVAAATEDGAIHVTEAATGKEVRSFPVGPAVTSVAFSPDGKRLALSQPGRPSIWDIDAGKEQPSAGGGGGGGGGGNIVPAAHVAFTPDGQTVVSIAMGQMMRSGPKGGGAMMMSNPAGGGCAAISPDGMIGGWCDSKGKLRIFQVGAQGPPVAPIMLQVNIAQCIAFAPGGKLLAVGGDNGVQLWDLAANKKTLLLTGLEKTAAQLTFSADGRTLAALADNGNSIQVWGVTRNIARCEIHHDRGAAGSQALSPNGKMLATSAKGGKQVFLWIATARQLTRNGPPLKLTAQDMPALWADLANLDADNADAAWRKLGAAGDSIVPFLRQQIRLIAVPPAKLQSIEKLVGELDSDQFATRERATRELMISGELAIVPLQRYLEKGLSAEAEKRIKRVLEKLGQPALILERQRVLEAIELLEQMRTAKSIALLEETERDALIPQIRLEARQALQRLAQWQKEKKLR